MVAEEQRADPKLIEKLQAVLARTKSPHEGEASVAAEMLQKLLRSHNLEMADLEMRGKSKPGVGKDGFDLGKAAFRWKLDLAQVVAEHFFCYAIVTHGRRAHLDSTVAFVGRPDNVESLKLLYGWLVEQVQRIAREERRVWIEENGHIDPLRWQVNFGEGAVRRLGERLREIKRLRQELEEEAKRKAESERTAEEEETMALVVVEDDRLREVSDWLEAQGSWYRPDGRPTKVAQEAAEKSAARRREMEELLANDPDEFYRRFPHMRPEEVARRQKEAEAAQRRSDRSYASAQTRRERYGSGGDWRQEEQAYGARGAGHRAAEKINVEPFLNGGTGKERQVEG